MPKKSSVFYLPTNIQDFINDELKQGSSSFDDLEERVNDQLEAKGLELRISRSSLHRYAKAREKLMQSNATMEMMAQHMGNVKDGKQGRLLMELIRSLAFDVTTDLMDPDKDIGSGVLKDLSLIVMRLEKADELNAARDAKVKEEALKTAVDEVDKVAKEAGISEDAINLVKEKFFGATS